MAGIKQGQWFSGGVTEIYLLGNPIIWQYQLVLRKMKKKITQLYFIGISFQVGKFDFHGDLFWLVGDRGRSRKDENTLNIETIM